VIYRSSYKNLFVSGRLDDGRPFVAMCGTHSSNYPYRHPKTGFDDLLLVVGADTFAIQQRRLALRLSLGPGEHAFAGFHGIAENDVGDEVHIDFELNLFASRHRARVEGIGVPQLMLGLLWEPALVVGTGNLFMHNQRSRIERAAGELELGRLTNLRGAPFEFGYEYTAAAEHEAVPVAEVGFRTYPLHNDSRGALMRVLLKLGRASESVRLQGKEMIHASTTDLRKAEPVVGHRIDLGPALITREIVRLGSGLGARYAFRERIDRKAP
jgi:hypothetical protein